jgi:hypothetical protein
LSPRSPSSEAKNVGNQHGRINVRAAATGSGTWSTVFNFAAVLPDGSLDEVGQITLSNTNLAQSMPGDTPYDAYVGWFSDDVGTVLTRVGWIVG